MSRIKMPQRWSAGVAPEGWGLLEVIEIFASRFLQISQSFGDIAFRILADAGVPSFKLDAVLTVEQKRNLGATFGEVQELAASAGLPTTAKFVGRFLDTLDQEITCGVAVNFLQHANHTFVDEAESYKMLFLSADDLGLYANGLSTFDPEFVRNFPECAYDLEEACRSLAVHRSTACVFHLMRVLELVVQKWAAKLGRDLVVLKKSGRLREMMWNDLEKEIQVQIELLPESTTQEKSLKNGNRVLIITLGNIRQAWRNATMHPADKYTVDEAKAIFESVRAFTLQITPVVYPIA